MRGNSHVQFLMGKAAVTPLTYITKQTTTIIYMKNILIIKILPRILVLSFSLLWNVFTTQATHSYKVALVHSYERNYHDAQRYRQTLEKELAANNIKFEIREYFLDCEEFDYYLELSRASYFIDEFTKWGAEIVAVFNNQATYSLLKCDNPKLKRIPVVFSGLYCPDKELIRQYPNATGYVDIPDYTRTIRMIEQLMGKSRVILMSGIGIMNNEIWSNLNEQCRKAHIMAYEGDVLEHILTHRIIQEGVFNQDMNTIDNERIDTTVVMRLMSETLPLRTIQLTARGTHTYFMQTARTFSSLDAADFFTNPSFATINDGFGSKDNMLGGYFTPLETQLKDMANGIAQRLRGEMPRQQMTQSRKEYVLNWKVMQRYGISTKNLPSEYHLMYIPFTVRYRYYILFSSVSGSLLVLLLIAYLTHSLTRERKRKKDALLHLLYEHETLKLAIEGGTTYAWRKEKDGLSFDSHFYKLISYPRKFITLEQIITFLHPEDSESFRKNFLKGDKHINYKGQYRCNFSGEYQWWEFRYSFVFNDGQASVVTGLLQNIQEIKDREAELIEARHLAECAELRQSFLNNMSHEIRTPLNAIVGFSNILISDPDLTEEDRQEFVDIINTNNALLLNLISDILELSRIDSGTVSFTVCEEDLRTLLYSYYQAFSMQIKPGLEFLQDFPDKDVIVHVDSMRLQQIINNFLTNANKFTDTGYIKLGYRLSTDEKTVRIFVEDTGKGISPNEQEIIFDRFYKHDEFAQGTGLGLSICRSIIDRMQGRLEVESEEGKGSRFMVVLPLE